MYDATKASTNENAEQRESEQSERAGGSIRTATMASGTWAGIERERSERKARREAKSAHTKRRRSKNDELVESVNKTKSSKGGENTYHEVRRVARRRERSRASQRLVDLQDTRTVSMGWQGKAAYVRGLGKPMGRLRS